MQPTSKWNKLDRLLYRAYRIMEDETSRNSGLPIWLTRNLDPEIMLTVEERTDVADRLLADWDKKHGGSDKKRGVSRYIVARSADGELLRYGGLTRQEFHRAAIQEEQDREDEVDVERDRPEEGYNPSEYGDGVTSPA